MPILNGVRNEIATVERPTVSVNGGKYAVVNGIHSHLYDSWRMVWNGHHFAPPPAGSVLYFPGPPGFGSTIHDFSEKFSDSAINTNEVLDATETDVDCDADATTAIPVGSIIWLADGTGEQMRVTATGVTLTVTRGYNGIATAHATGQDIFVWLPNHGAITGATWARLPSGLWVLEYTGGDDYVQVNSAAVAIYAGAHTIHGWGKLSAWASNSAVWGGGRTDATTDYSTVYFLTADKKFYAENKGGGTVNIKATTTTYNNDSDWHFFAVVTNASGHIVRFVVDGTNIGSATTNVVSLAAVDKFYVGQLPYTSANVSPWYGQMALHTAISGTQLSLAQLASVRAQQRHLFGV